MLEAFGSASVERPFDAIGQPLGENLGVFLQPLPDVALPASYLEECEDAGDDNNYRRERQKDSQPIRMGETLVSRWNSRIA